MRRKNAGVEREGPSWEEWVSAANHPGSPARPSDSRTREAVSRLAYSYWEGRGFQGGSAEEDWLRAEAELAGKVPASLFMRNNGS